MKYFNSFQKIPNTDSNNNIYILRNIVSRAIIVPELSKNPNLFYKYTLTENDTPENIAYKYYGDQYRYWIILLVNNILDPQWGWPLTSNQIVPYLLDKYDANSISELTSTVHHYEKIISTVNNTDYLTAEKTIVIDTNTYNTLNDSSTTYDMPDGSKVTQTIKKKAVSIYEYELNLNEEKRNINLIKTQYVDSIESSFQSLMST